VADKDGNIKEEETLLSQPASTTWAEGFETPSPQQLGWGTGPQQRYGSSRYQQQNQYAKRRKIGIKENIGIIEMVRMYVSFVCDDNKASRPGEDSFSRLTS
jgi:hypothetical protein